MSDENSVDSLALHYRDYEDGRSDKEYEGILDEDAEELRYEWQDDQDEILDDVDKEGSKKTDVKETERKEGHVYDAWEHGTTVIGDIDSAPDDFEEQKDQAARFSTSLGIPGVVRINLSALSQKIMGCVIDENVTTEYPWIYVRKEIIEDNIDLYPETSDFLPIKDQIEQYPGNKILVGYAPTTDDDEQGQFYVCVTLDGYNQMVKHIEDLRLEQQDRVRSAVYKTPGTWQDLGSGPIIDQNIVKPTRPDYVIEVETTVNQLKAPINLTDRPSDNQRDGYVALLPDRETFANVTRSLVDKSSNATSVIKEREAQTEIPMKTNFSNQCELDHKPSDNPPEGIVKAVNTFLKSKTDQVCKQIETNATWDVYANDYANLAGDDVNDTATGSTKYLERQCYYNGKLCSERVINDLAWHPQWTGIAATAYTTASKSENLVGRQPLNEVSASRVPSPFLFPIP